MMVVRPAPTRLLTDPNAQYILAFFNGCIMHEVLLLLLLSVLAIYVHINRLRLY